MNEALLNHMWELESECEAFMKYMQEKLVWLNETADKCAQEAGYVRAYSEIMLTLQMDFPTLAAMIRGGMLG